MAEGPKVLYGARRREQCPAALVAAALTAGTARVLTCAICAREVIAFVEMHDQALQAGARLRLEVQVLCFECTQIAPTTSDEMKAAQQACIESNMPGALIAETSAGVRVEEFEAGPVIPSKGGGYVH